MLDCPPSQNPGSRINLPYLSITRQIKDIHQESIWIHVSEQLITRSPWYTFIYYLGHRSKCRTNKEHMIFSSISPIEYNEYTHEWKNNNKGRPGFYKEDFRRIICLQRRRRRGRTEERKNIYIIYGWRVAKHSFTRLYTHTRSRKKKAHFPQNLTKNR